MEFQQPFVHISLFKQTLNSLPSIDLLLLLLHTIERQRKKVQIDKLG